MCLAKKSQVSAPPAAEQMVQPVQHQGGGSSSPTHPNKGQKEPRHTMRESSHGCSRGEQRQLEPTQLQFSIGISPGSGGDRATSILTMSSVWLLRDRMPQVVPAHCMWDTEEAPARAWAREVDALLFSSFSSQDQRDVKHSGRAAALKTASVE